MEDLRQTEDKMTKTLESKTSKIPSTAWLGLALGTMVCSAALRMRGDLHRSLFIGQWVAPFLLFGIYNKIVKTNGNDEKDSI